MAEEFKRLAETKGSNVNIHRVREVSSKNLSHADLYVSGPPTYFGKTTRGIMRFVKKLELPPGTKYAVLGTFSGVAPDKMPFLFTGVFGASTTMSTFTSETVYLFYDNEMLKAAWNAVLNGRGCLLGAFAGRFFLALLV
ncbi:MAG: CrcB family protein [Candidatus Methanomethylophilaceae archaeon]